MYASYPVTECCEVVIGICVRAEEISIPPERYEEQWLRPVVGIGTAPAATRADVLGLAGNAEPGTKRTADRTLSAISGHCVGDRHGHSAHSVTEPGTIQYHMSPVHKWYPCMHPQMEWYSGGRWPEATG